MALDIQKVFNNERDVWDISLAGDVDIVSSVELKDNVNVLLDRDEKSIQINCEHLSYIDSTGLGVLISLLKRVKKNGNEIEITNAQPNISKLLKITGLDKIFIMK
ncbi:MAG: STAS domain-containing protein [Clostridia bacterium]|nr:STAS domain-containing protein [Clostridia bacterium]